MVKRTLFFVNPVHLSIRNRQIAVKTHAKETKIIPVDDIGYIVLDHPQITYTQAFFQAAAARNIVVIICNEQHMPASMLLHLDTNYRQGELFAKQIEASEPLKKNLWKQTIQQKIRNQAQLLELLNRPNPRLKELAKEVKSGDSTGREALAAKYYWDTLFVGHQFYRHRYGHFPNNLFNYAYAVLRAATARALMGSGLLPIVGIHHRNRYNSYRLADDIMEPFRPFADQVVMNVYEYTREKEELTTEVKAELLKLLTCDVAMDELERPLMVALSHSTASLAQCFTGDTRKLKYPVFSNQYYA